MNSPTITAAIEAYAAAAAEHDRVMAIEINKLNFASFDEALEARTNAYNQREDAGVRLLNTIRALRHEVLTPAEAPKPALEFWSEGFEDDGKIYNNIFVTSENGTLGIGSVDRPLDHHEVAEVGVTMLRDHVAETGTCFFCGKEATATTCQTPNCEGNLLEASK